MQPKISIVTPSLNQGEFIEQTIQSVLNQDYPHYEYIIMDGGSTDGTNEIVKRYRSRIAHYESTADHGQAHAINKGFKIATGDYVGWLNSDDCLETEALSVIVKAFQKNPRLGTVCGRLRIIDTKGMAIGERSNTGAITKERLLNGGASIQQPGSFHRRELIEQSGFLDEAFRYAMDYELWVRLSCFSEIKQIDSFVALHRFHTASKTMSEFIRFIPEIKKVRKKYGGKLFCSKSISIARVELGYWRRKLIGR